MSGWFRIVASKVLLCLRSGAQVLPEHNLPECIRDACTRRSKGTECESCSVQASKLEAGFEIEWGCSINRQMPSRGNQISTKSEVEIREEFIPNVHMKDELDARPMSPCFEGSFLMMSESWLQSMAYFCSPSSAPPVPRFCTPTSASKCHQNNNDNTP